MTKSQIIVKAQLYLDDTSELSTQEFSDLFDKMYRKVNSHKTWAGLITEYQTVTDTAVPYIYLPGDFLYLTQNGNYTDSSEYSSRPVVFRGTDYRRYDVVSFADRRQYREQEGYAYVGYGNGSSILYFTKQPTTAELVEFDYYEAPNVLDTDESPWFPDEYHDVLYHMMVSDDFIIQQSDKAKSYKSENDKIAKDYLDQMSYWDSQLVQL